MAFSYPDYLSLRDRNHSFDGLAAYTGTQVGLDTGGNPARAFVDEVTGNYFDVLGIQPYLGRLFHAADEHGSNSAPFIVLNYVYWHSHFQADRGITGRTVLLNKRPFTIIGVAPPGFHGPVLFFSSSMPKTANAIPKMPAIRNLYANFHPSSPRSATTSESCRRHTSITAIIPRSCSNS